MDVNDTLEVVATTEAATLQPAKPIQPNGLLAWLDGVKATTAILLLCAAGLLAYANSFNGKFVWDDKYQIEQNKTIQSWKGIKLAFTTHIWQFIEESNTIWKKGNSIGYYRPLFTVLFTIEYQLFGLNPPGWHLISLLVHLLCSIMVYVVLLELSKRKSVALLAALLFAVYSIHVESVSWISGVTDPLFSFFFLLSFYLFLRFRATKKWSRLLVSVLCFGLAALSKETALSLVPLIFAMTWLGLPTDTHTGNEPAAAPWVSRFRRAVLWSLPYLAVAVLYLIARYMVLGAIVRDAAVNYRGPWFHTLLTLPYVIGWYVWDMLCPVDLTTYYYTPFVTDVRSLRFLIPTLVLMLSAAAVIRYRQHINRQVWYALLLFITPLLPVLNLKSLGENGMVYDRYLYLSLAGWTYLLALGVMKLTRLEQSRREFQNLPLVFRRLGLASTLTLALVGAMIAITWSENRKWKDEPSLWIQALRKHPKNWIAYYYAGLAFFGENRLAEARDALSHPIAQASESADVFNALGEVYMAMGDMQNAVANFNRSLEIDPQLVEAHSNLGIVAFNSKNFSAAEQSFQKASALNPKSADLHYYLALTYRLQGRFENAAEEFQQALTYLPDDPEIICELGLIYDKLGRKEEAVSTLKHAYSLSKSQALSDRIATNLNKMTAAVP